MSCNKKKEKGNFYIINGINTLNNALQLQSLLPIAVAAHFIFRNQPIGNYDRNLVHG